jgi:hypothetical protein
MGARNTGQVEAKADIAIEDQSSEGDAANPRFSH